MARRVDQSAASHASRPVRVAGNSGPTAGAAPRGITPRVPLSSTTRGGVRSSERSLRDRRTTQSSTATALSQTLPFKLPLQAVEQIPPGVAASNQTDGDGERRPLRGYTRINFDREATSKIQATSIWQATRPELKKFAERFKSDSAFALHPEMYGDNVHLVRNDDTGALDAIAATESRKNTLTIKDLAGTNEGRVQLIHGLIKKADELNLVLWTQHVRTAEEAKWWMEQGFVFADMGILFRPYRDAGWPEKNPVMMRKPFYFLRTKGGGEDDPSMMYNQLFGEVARLPFKTTEEETRTTPEEYQRFVEQYVTEKLGPEIDVSLFDPDKQIETKIDTLKSTELFGKYLELASLNGTRTG